MSPQELLYAPTHEWVHIEKQEGGKVATVGISAFAVELLTDLVFMELPEVGRVVKAGESMGEIESVKAVSDLYCPVNGEITEVNTSLPDHLETLNDDPHGAGWIVKVKITDESSFGALLDWAAYEKHCAEEG